jgi:hypothetical protein
MPLTEAFEAGYSMTQNNGGKCKKKLKECSKSLLEFHEIRINKGPYMITPCKHVFHAECLETWFKFKRECPNCKREIKL